MAKRKVSQKLTVDTLTHDEASRTNIPTAEYQSVMREEDQAPKSVRYERGGQGLEEEKGERNRDLDPQLVWRGKDQQDWSDLVVHAPPLYIQEKVHPKALIDDLRQQTEQQEAADDPQFDLFADFNGIPEEADKTDFYRHEGHWQNRMILGDSLQVMASLAEREGLRGKVQCIYFDPPYGIKFNSNFQWSTTSRDVKDGKAEQITREPEQVKAFRDTWRDGIHSYLTYLRDRLTVARDLLTDSGSIFVQIGDENVHRVRAVMDEVFGEDNFVSEVILKTTSGAGSPSGGTLTLAGVHDAVLWFAKNKESVKYRQLYFEKAEMSSANLYKKVKFLDGTYQNASTEEMSGIADLENGAKRFRPDNLTSQSSPESALFPVAFCGKKIKPGKGGWKTNKQGMNRLIFADRLYQTTNNSLQYLRGWKDFDAAPINNVWTDVGTGSFTDNKIYIVQSNTKAIQRCVLMSSDPGDLVLDPTCGSGTTAYVAEQWGRRWITIDTSRVALALARARIMGARYPYYLLADSPEGQHKEAEVTRSAPASRATHGDIRHGFVYERVPHITLKSIANNAEIDVIWERYQEILEPLRQELNTLLGTSWEEWEIPRELSQGEEGATSEQENKTTNEHELTRIRGGNKEAKAKRKLTKKSRNDICVHSCPFVVPEKLAKARKLLGEWWEQRIARQREIDASIAAKADHEYLYDKPYEDKKRVRVAGPFTVESLSPHRILGVDEDDELIDPVKESEGDYEGEQGFVEMILENLKSAGVQQAHKEDRIEFSALSPWPGDLICATGEYETSGESPIKNRAAIFIGPEFGTVSRPDLVKAAREAGDAGFDVLIACAFNFEAHATEFDKLGRIPVLKARMNADLHMADDLKNTGKGNLFVIFGEPDIDILEADDGMIQVQVNGVDVFKPQTGEVISDNADGIACWFIDTDYNEESFFVRQAYFLGQNDPYKALKTTLKAEIDAEAWASLNSDLSRPFPKPKSGRIAVKVINHLGDEVMKVFRV
jgi:adenine-specific DNA-methyltransferase